MKKIIGMILALAVLLSTVPSLAEVQAGNVITFGTFEQDNDKKDGKEPIEWIVLEITENQAFVVSRYVLTARQFHNGKKNFDWSKSAIRKWLNGDFLNAAFTEEEQALAKRIRGLLKQENGMKTLLSLMEKADTSEALSAALDEAEKAE